LSQAEHQFPDSPATLTTLDAGFAYSETTTHVRSSSGRSNRIPFQLFRYRVIKRWMDCLFVIAMAPILLPVMAVIGTLVVLTSPGPIFYSHRRLRRNGMFFSMWKFRTMCVNSAEVLEDYLSCHPEARKEWNQCHKLRNDPRITRVGYFLRRYSLDELPQFWNVFNGSMSLVGPRPIVAAEVEKYAEYFSFYCRVNPGLTGLWQVSGRSTLTYPARVQLDRKYVETWSLTNDFKILLKTFRSVANKDGAF
jgi:lipopolysaccharide/colanic/teichoic acid biosynthesis glycosyltransferase